MFDCFIYQAPWKNVLELLFKVGAPCENYKKPKCVYEFRKKVVAGMKARYEKVSAPGSHSAAQDPKSHEDLMEVDQLAVKLYTEYQEAADIQEALKRDAALQKENIENASQFLAPHPKPLPRSLDGNGNRNPLSSISNDAPYLISETTAKPMQSLTKKQRLTSYDLNEVMVSYTATNKESERTFQSYMNTKMEVEKNKIELEKEKMELEKEKLVAEKRQYIVHILEKKMRGEILQEEFGNLESL